MNNRTWVAALVAAAAIGMSAEAIDAQRAGQRGMRQRAGAQMKAANARRGLAIERILRQRESLELTEAQVNSLNGLRLQTLESRSAMREARGRIMSDVVAGETTRADVADELHALRDQQHEAADETRAAVEDILTEAQQEQLSERRRRGVRGRTGMRRDGPRRRGPRMRRPGARF